MNWEVLFDAYASLQKEITNNVGESHVDRRIKGGKGCEGERNSLLITEAYMCKTAM